MQTTTELKLTFAGNPVDTSAEALGELRRSDASANFAERMQEDGYLFLPGYLDVEAVLAARRTITNVLAEQGALTKSRPAFDAIPEPDKAPAFEPAEALRQPSVQQLLYGPRMIQLYEKLLGGAVRHFDFTWIRAQWPGIAGTLPHCDIVYMGRGTHRLFTAWTPFGDVPLGGGGLMILENSHRQTDKLKNYLARDVDAYCANGKQNDFGGYLSNNSVTLREKLGGRWLTTEFHAGDVLTFSMATVHTSVDNHSERIRLSTDSRYQLASEPADHRWIGENPIGHGQTAKRGLIC